MARQEHRGAPPAALLEEGEEPVAAHGVEARSGLVEDEELGPVDERRRQPHAPLHPPGEPLHAAVRLGGEADPLQEGRGRRPPRPARHAVERAGGLDALPCREEGMEVRLLGHVAGPASGFTVARGEAEHAGLPRGGGVEAEKEPQSRGLAGPVGPQQADHGTPGHDEVEAVEGLDGIRPGPAAVPLGEAAGLDGGDVGHGRHPGGGRNRMDTMIGGGGRGGKAGGASAWADGAALSALGALLLGWWAAEAAAVRALPGGEPPPDPSEFAHLVDLSTAGEEELRLLPGVGPALAARIAAERARGGGFASLDEVGRRVPGVGPARVAWWRGRAVPGGGGIR